MDEKRYKYKKQIFHSPLTYEDIKKIYLHLDKRTNESIFVFSDTKRIPGFMCVGEGDSFEKVMRYLCWKSYVADIEEENKILREALARVKAVWEDVHDETSIVGIIDNALGLEPAPETEE